MQAGSAGWNSWGYGSVKWVLPGRTSLGFEPTHYTDSGGDLLNCRFNLRILTGFCIAALSLVIGFSGSPSLKLVRESSHYPTLWKTFAEANRALGLATVMSLLALIFDRDHSPSRLIFFAVVYAALLAALRVGRSIWILEQVVRLVAGKKPTIDE
jgi:hypothetical protein